jgi:hypothetical protein
MDEMKGSGSVADTIAAGRSAHDKAVNRLRAWVLARAKWMDSALGQCCMSGEQSPGVKHIVSEDAAAFQNALAICADAAASRAMDQHVTTA